jgi:hypothetical protein
MGRVVDMDFEVHMHMYISSKWALFSYVFV